MHWRRSDTDGRSVNMRRRLTPRPWRTSDSTPTGMGVFGLSFYENNTDRLQVATMSGVTPSTETISVGEYPVSRPLQFYVKQEHLGVIPGLKEYVQFFISDAVAGNGGPLADYGLVPDPALAETQAMVDALN